MRGKRNLISQLRSQKALKSSKFINPSLIFFYINTVDPVKQTYILFWKCSFLPLNLEKARTKTKNIFCLSVWLTNYAIVQFSLTDFKKNCKWHNQTSSIQTKSLLGVSRCKWNVSMDDHLVKEWCVDVYVPELHRPALSCNRVFTYEGSGHRFSGVSAPLVLLNNTTH